MGRMNELSILLDELSSGEVFTEEDLLDELYAFDLEDSAAKEVLQWLKAEGHTTEVSPGRYMVARVTKALGESSGLSCIGGGAMTVPLPPVLETLQG